MGLQRVRLFSSLLALLTVAGAAAMVRQFWPKPAAAPWRLAALGLVAFNPTFLYLSHGATNDLLLIMLSTWSLVLLLAWLRAPPDAPARGFVWRGLGLAVLLGGAVLTKQTGLMLLPLAGLVVVYDGRRRHWPWLRVAGVLVAGGVVVTAVGGWWYVRNGLLYADPLALSAHGWLAPFNSLGEHLRFMGGQLWGAFQSYWAAFGWATVFVHPFWYALAGVMTLGGLAGWIRPGHGPKPPHPLVAVLGTAVLVNGLLLLYWQWKLIAPYGRLLFPVIAPVACLLVESWRRLWGRCRPRWLTAGCLLLGMALFLLLALGAPFRYLKPSFAAPLATTEALAQRQPIEAEFGATYRLTGYTITPETATPGTAVDLALYWTLTETAHPEEDAEVVVHLAPQNPEQRVAEASDLLGLARYPTSVWQPGDNIVQHHQLVVPDWASVPGLYWFGVGIRSEQSAELLPLTGDVAEAGEMARLGPVRLVPGNKVRPAQATNFRFAEGIVLTGYDAGQFAAGDDLTVTLFWQATAVPVTDWTIFAHLLDETGALIAQADALPAQGAYPTNWWQPGDQVTSTHTFTLPPGSAAQSYTLLTGLYDTTTGRRLSVVTAQGNPLANAAVPLLIRRD